MTRIHHYAIGILAIAVALALSISTAPASARTFTFNSVGSMVQQPLPPQFACALRRALSGRSSTCREATDR